MDGYVNKVALVTGASTGIGASIAKELVIHGMTVIGVARRREKLQNVEDELRDELGNFVPYCLDVTVLPDIYTLFEYIKKNFKGIDVCVNAAGTILTSSLLDGTPDEWTYLMTLHVTARCLICQLTVKSLKDRGLDEGDIINISSYASRKILPSGFTHFYSTTKFALHAITEGFRQELKSKASNIRVTEICPGLTTTDMLNLMPLPERPDASELIKAMLPENIAQVVIQVLSVEPIAEVHEIVVGPTIDLPY